MGKKKKRINRHLPPDFVNAVKLEDIPGGWKPKPYPPPPPPPPSPPEELWYEISFYGTYIFSSRPHPDLGPNPGLAAITLYSDSHLSSPHYVGAIVFYADGEPLPNPELLYQADSGIWVIGLNYHISRYHDIMEMLRTEPHVFVYYRGPYNSVISTVFPADYYA